MRLLFLALSPPLPANNGHRLRTWALLRALAADGHKVTLMAFGNPSETAPADRARLAETCGDVELIPLAWTQLSVAADFRGRLRTLPSALPYSVLRFRSPEMRRRIAARLAGAPFDAVVCDVFTAVNLPETPLPILLNNENIEHIILRRYLNRERNPAKLAYASLEYWKLKRWEREICRKSTVGMACSDTDRTLLARLAPSLRLVIVPNVVDIVPDGPAMPEHPRTVLFQGGLDWYPNRDAVMFFATAILPELRRLVPDVRVVIAGRHPDPNFVRRFQHIPALTFTGTVADMRAVIAQATVCLAPMRIGSGTRLKILEAAAMAKPTVSTSIGAEGLDFLPGEEIFLADAPPTFAHATATLLRDRALRQAIGQAARARVEKQYTLPALMAPLRDVLGSLRPCSAVDQPSHNAPTHTTTSA